MHYLLHTEKFSPKASAPFSETTNAALSVPTLAHSLPACFTERIVRSTELKIHHLFSINEPSFGFHGIIYFWILLLKRNILVISRAYFNILSEKDENDDNYFGHYLPLVRHYFSGSIVLCHSMKHLFSLFSLSSPQREGSVVLLAHTWPEAHMCIYQPFNIFFFHHRVSACTCTRSFKHMTKESAHVNE